MKNLVPCCTWCFKFKYEHSDEMEQFTVQHQESTLATDIISYLCTVPVLPTSHKALQLSLCINEMLRYFGVFLREQFSHDILMLNVCFEARGYFTLAIHFFKANYKLRVQQAIMSDLHIAVQLSMVKQNLR